VILSDIGPILLAGTTRKTLLPKVSG
jgi:hypothetical protein